jgi:hypothetical protein
MKVTILIFLLGFLTVAPSIVVGNMLFDGRVEDNSYEKGLAYDEMQKVIMNNGLKITVRKIEQTEKSVIVDFTLGKGSFHPEQISTAVERPVGKTSVQGKLYEAGSSYELSLPRMDKGYHILCVNFDVDGKPVRLKKNFYIN